MILFSSMLSNTTLTLNLTFSRPGSQGAVVIDEVIESEGQDEEGAVTRHVHLEGHIPLVQAHSLTFLGQRGLEKFSSHLGENNEQ